MNRAYRIPQNVTAEIARYAMAKGSLKSVPSRTTTSPHREFLSKRQPRGRRSTQMKDLRVVQHDLSYSGSKQEISQYLRRYLRRPSKECRSKAALCRWSRDGRGCGNRYESDKADRHPEPHKIVSGHEVGCDCCSWVALHRSRLWSMNAAVRRS